MKLYLDNSFLNRPFDDSSVGKNKLEAEILLQIIELAEYEKVALVNSAMIEYENFFNTLPERKVFVEDVMKTAKRYQGVDSRIHQRALTIHKQLNIDALDALHIASAEAAKVDFFITCDYPNIRKYKGPIRLVTPLGFIHSYESNY